jgi:Tol biopolymer transport system component
MTTLYVTEVCGDVAAALWRATARAAAHGMKPAKPALHPLQDRRMETRNGQHEKEPGGTAPAESLLASPQVGYTGVWLNDGSGVVTTGPGIAPGGGSDIGLVRNGGRGPIEPLVASRFEESHPAPSPDNRGLAYQSNQSGRNEVYVRALEAGGDEIQVSVGGGAEPVWGRGSRELFYRGGAAALPQLMVAVIEGPAAPAVSSRRALFPVPDIVTSTPHANYDISPDGASFAMVQNNPSTRIMVIQNLPALVAKLRGEGR